MNDSKKPAAIDTRAPWVAPQWQTLDVAETAMAPTARRDGGMVQADCTLS